MKALYGEKEMLLASNKSLAEYNLSQVCQRGDYAHELSPSLCRSLC